MVLADSHRIPRVPCYLGENIHYAVYLYRIITFYDLAFQLIPVQRIIMLNILQFFNCSSHNPT